MRVIFVLLVIRWFDPCTIHIFRAKSYFGYFSNFWIYQIRGYPDQKSDLANRSGMPFYVESYGACFLPFCVWKKLWPKNRNFNGILSDYPKSGPGTFFPKKNRKNFFCISGYIDPGEAKKPLGPHVKSQYFGGYGQKSKTGYTKSAISRLKIDFVNYRCDSPER